MALFNTPNILDIIWREQRFPADGGSVLTAAAEGLMDTASSTWEVGKQYRADKRQWEESGGEGYKPRFWDYWRGDGGNLSRQSVGFADQNHSEMTQAVNGMADNFHHLQRRRFLNY